MNEEFDYLKYIYFSLDFSTVLKLQSEAKVKIPEKYRLVGCDFCKYILAEEKCSFCEKNICEACTIRCYTTKTVVCKNHGDICKICNIECACLLCGKPSRNICEKCISKDPRRKMSCKQCSCIDILNCRFCGESL